jgi:hypothetical protein
MHQLGVLNKLYNQLSPRKAVIDVCSPFDKEFMDHHEIKHLKKKGVDSVELRVLKSDLVKRFKNCQVCDFEGRGMVTSHLCYCKVHRVRLCMNQHQYLTTIGSKKTD